jgi:hypothetical protein
VDDHRRHRRHRARRSAHDDRHRCCGARGRRPEPSDIEAPELIALLEHSIDRARVAQRVRPPAKRKKRSKKTTAKKKR